MADDTESTYTLCCPDCDWEFEAEGVLEAAINAILHRWVCNE